MPSTWEPVFMPLRKLHFWVLRNSRYPTSLQSCTLFCSFKLHGLPLSAGFKAHWEFNLGLLGLRLLSLSCLALLSDLSLWIEIWKVLSGIEDSPTRVLENLQSSILDCSQIPRGIRRCLKMRRCHRRRVLGNVQSSTDRMDWCFQFLDTSNFNWYPLVI